jgi:dipeptidyl aminopeptidase/acylaminoacyl peptidase
MYVGEAFGARTRRVLCSVGCVAMFLCAIGISEESVNAAEGDQSAIESFGKQSSLVASYRIALSPDSTVLAYLVRTPNSERTGTHIELRTMQTKTKRVMKLCCDYAHDAVAPSWSPDGGHLAFVRRLSASPGSGGQAVVYDRSSGNSRDVAHIIVPSDDRLLFSADIKWTDNWHILLYGMTPVVDKDGPDYEASFRVWSSFPDRAGVSNVETRPAVLPSHDVPIHSVVSVDIRNDNVALLADHRRMQYSEMSPDGHYLAYAEYQDTALPSQLDRFKPYVLDLRTHEIFPLPGDIFLFWANVRVFNWRDDSAVVAFPSQNQSATTAEFSYRVAESRDWKAVLALEPLVVPRDSYTKCLPAIWSDGGRRLTIVTWDETDHVPGGTGSSRSDTQDTSSRFVTWDLPTKRVLRSVRVKGIYLSEVVSEGGPDRNIIGIGTTTALDSAPVLRYSPSDGEIKQICALNAAPQYMWGQPVIVAGGGSFLVPLSMLDHYVEIEEVDWQGRRSRLTDADLRVPGSIARYEHLEWRGANGDSLQGGLMVPAAYDQSRGKRLPLIVRIYPGEHPWNGPYSYDLQGVSRDAHAEGLALVEHGYAVFVPDCPTGPSPSFPTDLTNDVFPGIQTLIDLEIADPNRIGLIGHSDGVEASLQLLTLSHQFKAAVLTDGFDNFLTEFADITGYGTSAVTMGHLPKPPWEDPQEYISISPVFRLNRINAPILLFHGSADTEVPLYAGEEIFTDLRAAGKVAELVEYEGGGHGLSDRTLGQQIDSISRTLNWFDRYLNGTTSSISPGLSRENPR